MQFVLSQPWEYGFLPRAWVQPIQEAVDEVWCYSNYVREVYLASGIAEEKLKIVPLGVDEAVFSPDAPPYVFTTEAGNQTSCRCHRCHRCLGTGASNAQGRLCFCLWGGTLQRKGIDILIGRLCEGVLGLR